MKSVFHCKSCGFVSTYRQAYVIFLGILVCKECKEAYGMDLDVTRWVNDAVENNAKPKRVL
jgi:hypothetical protein